MQPDGKKTRFGFVALMGRPNVGKSTLLNRLIGEKASAISPRPQTTRQRILGILTTPETQIAFFDTPGVQSRKGPLNRTLLDSALSTLREVDVVAMLGEAGRPLDGDDRLLVDALRRAKRPIVLVLNKIDLVQKAQLLPKMEELAKVFPGAEIVPISARTGDGVELLFEVFERLLPEGERLYPEGMWTDRPEDFLIGELIREKVFYHTSQEVPYSAAVVVESIERREGRGAIVVHAKILVERDSQKGILIGKGGQRLKAIGRAARREIESLLERPVYLDLFVGIEHDWTRDPRAVRRYAADS